MTDAFPGDLFPEGLTSALLVLVLVAALAAQGQGQDPRRCHG
jgi:hypothetical protein